MIDIKRVKHYCNEDISLIENYEKAIYDKETWDCHHRKETNEGLSSKQLIELDLYFNRPANELIFLTHGEHTRLHQGGKPKPKETIRKRIEACKGKKLSEEHKQKLSSSLKGKHRSEETKQKMSAARKGKHRVWNNENDHSKGYHFEI